MTFFSYLPSERSWWTSKFSMKFFLFYSYAAQLTVIFVLFNNIFCCHSCKKSVKLPWTLICYFPNYYPFYMFVSFFIIIIYFVYLFIVLCSGSNDCKTEVSLCSLFFIKEKAGESLNIKWFPQCSTDVYLQFLLWKHKFLWFFGRYYKTNMFSCHVELSF